MVSEDKMCFLFGHSTTPQQMQELIEQAVNDYYDSGYTIFVVGYHGSFDRMATGALRRLKEKHPEVILFVLTPYHPAEREIPIPKGFDTSFYPPEMEFVPRKFCIVRANEYMIQRCDGIICYASYPGNARNLLEKAIKRKKPIRNIAAEASRMKPI